MPSQSPKTRQPVVNIRKAARNLKFVGVWSCAIMATTMFGTFTWVTSEGAKFGDRVGGTLFLTLVFAFATFFLVWLPFWNMLVITIFRNRVSKYDIAWD